jgi:hypothetical protein
MNIHSAKGHLCCLNLHPAARRSKGGQQAKGDTTGEDNKEVLADPNYPDKKLKISSKLDPK